MYGGLSFPVTASTEVAAVPVRRLVGRYELRISDANLSEGESISVKSVQVKNMASSVCPFGSGYKADETVETGDRSSASDIASLNAGRSVYYYVAENLQGEEPGIDEPGSKIPSYDYSFVDPDKATYLEVKCTHSRAGNDTDTVYRLFLGGNSTTDFNIRRNTSYVITLAPFDLKAGLSWWKCEPDFRTVPASLEYLKVILDPPVIGIGEESVVTVMAFYSDGTTVDVTDDADKRSGNEAVATISGNRLYGKSSGISEINASFGGKTANATLTVDGNPVTIRYITVSLRPSTISVGDKSSVTVLAYYSNGATGNVTASAQKTSGNTSVATISGNILTGLSGGESTISAIYMGMSDSAVLTVQASPGEPVDPDEPDGPNEPDEPDQPDGPDGPDEPDNPDQPDEPDGPDEPDEPDQPDEPDGPDQPDEPDGPDQPDEPDGPDEPDEPDQPDVPDVITHKLVVSPGRMTVKVSHGANYTARYYTITNDVSDDGVDVTASAYWSVAIGRTYARSNGGGSFTGIAAGSAVIQARYEGIAANAELIVEQPNEFNVSCTPSCEVIATYYAVNNGSHIEHTTERTSSKITFMVSKNKGSYIDVTNQCTMVITSGNTLFRISPEGVVTSNLNPTEYLQKPKTGSFNSTSLNGTVQVSYADEEGTVHTRNVAVTVILRYDNGSTGLRN